MHRVRGVFLCAALALVVCAAAGLAQAAVLALNGAGATLPASLYGRWATEYGKLHPDIKINYEAAGSGAGIEQISRRIVDFGATDSPMSDEELDQAPSMLHVPAALGAIAVVYNLGAAQVSGLRFDGDLLADIFLGRVSEWSDPRIAAANPGVKLPDMPIALIHRSDRSGSTAVFTDFLTKVSSEWRNKVGTAMVLDWPTGLGARGTEGSIALVKGTVGAIGYVEFAAAQRHRLSVAAIRNPEGEFVRPSLSGALAAAVNVAVPLDFRVSLTNAPGSEAYPLSSYTYLLVCSDHADLQRGKALVSFLWWAIHDGQQYAAAAGFVPLPRGLVGRLESSLHGLTIQGAPAW